MIFPDDTPRLIGSSTSSAGETAWLTVSQSETLIGAVRALGHDLDRASHSSRSTRTAHQAIAEIHRSRVRRSPQPLPGDFRIPSRDGLRVACSSLVPFRPAGGASRRFGTGKSAVQKIKERTPSGPTPDRRCSASQPELTTRIYPRSVGISSMKGAVTSRGRRPVAQTPEICAGRTAWPETGCLFALAAVRTRCDRTSPRMPRHCSGLGPLLRTCSGGCGSVHCGFGGDGAQPERVVEIARLPATSAWKLISV